METEMKAITCCFTGHRQISPEIMPTLATELESVLLQLIGDGFRFFCAGGALGFDTLAAETVLHLKMQYPQIRLILVLPCHEQTRGWKPEDVRRYEAIRKKADKVIYTAEHYTRGCMHLRNRYLVDHSAVCVAYCTRTTGGSAYTMAYARRQGAPVIRLGTEQMETASRK